MHGCKIVCIAWTVLLLRSASAQSLPDLVPLQLLAPSSITSARSPSVQLAWHIINQGPGEIGNQRWNDSLYVSANPWFDESTALLTSLQGASYMCVGDGYWRTNRADVPVDQTGTYYFILRANSNQNLPEADHSNNQFVVPFDFVCTPADLSPLRLLVPAVVQGPPNPFVTVAWGVTNLGLSRAAPSWIDRLHFSTNSSLDSSASVVGSQYEQNTIVPPGGDYWRTNTFRLPVTRSGSYFLIFQTDAYNSLNEANTDNNVVVVPIEVDIRPADLSPVLLQVPATITNVPYPPVTLVYVVTNLGGALGPEQNWSDIVVLSTDAVRDISDWTTLASERGPLAAGAGYRRTNTFYFPVLSNGTYYVFLESDGYNLLLDANTNNNRSPGVPVAFSVQLPDLVPLALVPSSVTGPPEPYITFVGGGTNQGLGAANSYWSDRVYLSTNASLEFASYVSDDYQFIPVAAGAGYFYTNSVRLPVTNSGNYYLLFEANIGRQLYESDWSNNVVAVPFTLTIQRPDLEPVSLGLSLGAVSPPEPYVEVVSTITNHGPGLASGNSNWFDRIFLSTNPVLTSSAMWVAEFYQPDPVDPGTSYFRTNRVLLPITESGTYYLFLISDSYNGLLETREDNNAFTTSFTVTIERGDLVPLVSEIPKELTGPQNPMMELVWGVTNQGPGITGRSSQRWNDGIYFSADPVLDTSDTLFTFYEWRGPLAAGASYFVTNSVVLPVTNSGSFYLFFKTDRSDWISEQDESNNVAMVQVRYTMAPPADLVIREVQVPGVVTGSPNPIVTIIWQVQNQGGGEARGLYNSWFDTLYLSRDATLSPADIPMASFYPYRLAPGQSVSRANGVRLPVVTNTNLYLILKTDSANDVPEFDESNNQVTVPIRFEILNPDLEPIALTVTNHVVAGPNPKVNLSWGVTNRGPGLAKPNSSSWCDFLFISTNSTFDASARIVWSWYGPESLSPGSSYWRNEQLVLPVQQSGAYYLFIEADPSGSVCELNRANNIIRVPVTITILPGVPLSLNAFGSAGNIVFTWPASVSGFKLQSTTNIVDPSSWTTLSGDPVMVGDQNTVTNLIGPRSLFYRLKGTEIP